MPGKKTVKKPIRKTPKKMKDSFVQGVLKAGSRKEVAGLIAREAGRLFGACPAWIVILPPDGSRPVLVAASKQLRLPKAPDDELIQWVADQKNILQVIPGRQVIFQELKPNGEQWRSPAGPAIMLRRYQKSRAWLGKSFEKGAVFIASLDTPKKKSRILPKDGKTILVLFATALTEQVKAEVQPFIQTARMAVGMTGQKKSLAKRLRQTTSIAEIAQNINAILDLDILLRLIILEVANAMQCQASDIWMTGEQTSELVCKTSLGLAADLRGRPLAAAYTRQAMKTGDAVWIENVGDDEKLDQELLRSAGIVSMAVIPLKIKNKIIGVLHLFAKKQHAFVSEERVLLKTLVNQATTAIDNANLFEETKQRAQELLALYEVAQVISEVSNLTHALEQIVGRVSEVLNVEKCWLMFLDKKNGRLSAHSAAVGFYEEQIEAMNLPLDAPGISSRVFHSAREMFTNTAEQEPLVEAEFKKQFKLRNLMAVPLRGQEETFGVFFVANKKGGNLFKGNDVRLFRTMASEASVIIRNATLYNKLKSSYQSVIQIITGMIDVREPYTRGHSGRVAVYSAMIAKQLQLPEDIIERIRMAGLMHDIGKIGIPENVLLKTEALTPEEQAAMERHPEIGGQILENIELPWNIHDLVLCHHEAYDGSGFPNGLQQEDIPLGSRIIAVADAFDVATSSVGQQPSELSQDGFAMILKESGRHFDPRVVSAFEKIRTKVQAVMAERHRRKVD
ncbi:GAF domain-containing protein [bacterium]|nr:GAF domain-containing protein [bacterium]